MGTLYGRDERHVFSVPLARISPHFTAAVIAAEDHRFFEHGPVDEAALARSVFQAFAQHHTLGGASTISMQLARLLSPVPPTLLGKLQETFAAARLESGLSKMQILEAYCNRVPMGSNLYGVEAAARTYFGIQAADLDLAQASLLAALPNDPVRLDPYRHWNVLKARQAYVLARMSADGRISAEQAAQARVETIHLQELPPGIVAAPHFLFRLAQDTRSEQTRVTTSLDLSLQRFVQAQVRAVVQALASHNVHDAAAVVIDNHTREILAYVGSPDYFDNRILGRNDGVQALRQPGSALKPFLYELALERRLVRPTTILQDVPTTYALPGARSYQPEDYSKSFQGPVRVRVALANSLNVPAVRVLERVGVPAFLQRLRDLGFVHLDKPAEYYGLGLTLGGGEVTLLELTQAYVSAANAGSPAAAASPASWALVTNMLADAHARAAAFGVASVLALPFPAAVKTGTSSDYRDTWTVGFTRDYTVGVWVGNFDGSPMRRISGVSGAGPLWNRIMLHLHERREPQAFDLPQGYVRRPICAETGMRPTNYCPAVVTELLDSQDLRAYLRAPVAARLWPAQEKQSLRIIFPREGDRFAKYPGADPSQGLQFAFSGKREHLVVCVDGHRLTPVGSAYFWPLALGTHLLRVHSEKSEAVTHFTVAPPPILRTGFSSLR